MGEFEERKTELIFPTLDPQEISDEIGAEDRGRKDGNNNMPPAASQQSSATEAEIVDFFEAKLRDAAAATRSMILSLSYDRRKLDLQQILGSLRALPEKSANEIAHLKELHRPHLQDQKEVERKLRGSLQTFMSENRLNNRVARTKDNPFAFWLVVVAFVIAETLLNASFFAMGSERGYLGGAIQAIIISIINVGVSVLCGLFGLPLINHIQYVRKVIGGLALLIWGLVVGLLNVFAGHYRSELEQDPLLAVTAAVDSIKQSLWGIESGQGWLLTGVGVLFAAIVLLKVYFSDDPYPHYSKTVRVHNRAKDEWLHAQSEFTELLRSVCQKLEDERVKLLTDARRVVGMFEANLNNAENLGCQFQDYRHRVATWCQGVIARYRNANIAVREDDELPSYFAERSSVSFADLNVEIDVDEDRQMFTKLKADLKDFSEQEAGEIQRKLNAVKRVETEGLQGFFNNLSVSTKGARTQSHKRTDRNDNKDGA